MTTETPRYYVRTEDGGIASAQGSGMIYTADCDFSEMEWVALLDLLNEGHDNLSWEEIEPLVAKRVNTRLASDVGMQRRQIHALQGELNELREFLDAANAQAAMTRPLVEALADMAPAYYPEEGIAVCLCCPAEVTPRFDPSERPAGMDAWEDARRRLEHDHDCPIGIARRLQAQWQAPAATSAVTLSEGGANHA